MFDMEVKGAYDFSSDSSMRYNYKTDVIIEQFTGLKDVNGVEIYEGDIVRFDVIKGNLDHDQYERDQVGEVRIAPNGVSFGGWRYGWVCNIEVIGNIHQTPELSEGDKWPKN